MKKRETMDRTMHLAPLLAVALGLAACQGIPGMDMPLGPKPGPSPTKQQELLGTFEGLFGERALSAVKAGTYTLERDVFLHLQAIPTLQISTTDAQTMAKRLLEPHVKACEVREGDRGFSVLRLSGLETFGAEQETESWCWAACVQMVNAYRKVRLQERNGARDRTQQQIVADLFVGGEEDRGAGMSTIWRAVNPDLERELQKASSAQLPIVVGMQWIVSDDIVESLLQGVPAIVGMQDGDSVHAVVVMGATVAPSENAWSGSLLESLVQRGTGTNVSPTYAYHIHRLEVFDPWKGRGVRTITAEEFQLLARTIVAPHVGRAMMLRAVEHPVKSEDVLGEYLPASFWKR